MGKNRYRDPREEYVRPHIDPELQRAWDKAATLKDEIVELKECIVELQRLIRLNGYLDVAEMKKTLLASLSDNGFV